MKTYIFDSINRYKRFSENLDVKTILCNKSWWVFNDSGDKEIYIFQENNSLIISISGNVTNATWQYIPANKSLVISSDKQSYMLHPTFVDNIIFALQVDGTEQYSFMINEEQCEVFQPKSLNDLELYFKKKEQLEFENQKLQQAQIAKEEQAFELAQAEQKRRTEEEKLIEQALQNSIPYQIVTWISFILFWIVPIIATICYLLSDEFQRNDLETKISYLISCACSGVSLYIVFVLVIGEPIQKRITRRVKKEHGFD